MLSCVMLDLSFFLLCSRDLLFVLLRFSFFLTSLCTGLRNFNFMSSATLCCLKRILTVRFFSGPIHVSCQWMLLVWIDVISASAIKLLFLLLVLISGLQGLLCVTKTKRLKLLCFRINCHEIEILLSKYSRKSLLPSLYFKRTFQHLWTLTCYIGTVLRNHGHAPTI